MVSFMPTSDRQFGKTALASSMLFKTIFTKQAGGLSVIIFLQTVLANRRFENVHRDISLAYLLKVHHSNDIT